MRMYMLLSDHISEAFALNGYHTKGWSTVYYGVFSEIIKERNCKVVAEIGIGYGTHAKQVLQNTNIDRLYLIDPMKEYPNDGFPMAITSCIPKVPGNHFNELYDAINENLKDYKDKYTWFRKESLQISDEEIPSEHLDAVFIDANHTYNYVYNDLHFWWNKVKSGGIVLGDDYWMDDVARAVHDFAKDKHLQVRLLMKEGQSHKIYFFEKP